MLHKVSHALTLPSHRLPTEGKRVASVALVLDQDANLLFIQRAERKGDPWSGHIGLPGGHVEANEPHEAAAQRETLEEVGLDLTAATALGALHDLATPSRLPSRIVRPFVFLIDAFGSFVLQPREVAATHLFPLQHLLLGTRRGSFLYPYEGNEWRLPCVDLNGVRLWGLTLRIIDDLLNRIDGQGTGLDRPGGFS